MTSDDRLLTIDELSTWLQIPKATIYGRRHRGDDMPPCVRIGPALRWDREVVRAWLEEHSEAM